jgi:hypothetical protein
VYFLGLASAKGVIIINGRAFDAQRVLDALLSDSYVDIKTEGSSLVIGGTKIQPISRSVQELAMLRTCFGSLAYCCSLDRKCVDRDGALELLGLTTEDYERIKTSSHQAFIDVSRRIIDSSSLKNPMWAYQGSLEMSEDKRVDSTRSRQFDSGSYYKGSSTSYGDTRESSETSPSEGKSYSPIDLSLLFGESSARSSTSSADDENRMERTPGAWRRSGNMSMAFDNRKDEREEDEEPTTHCIHCRAQLPLRARFCPNCGESVA